jgi:hypothetical protein
MCFCSDCMHFSVVIVCASVLVACVSVVIACVSVVVACVSAVIECVFAAIARVFLQWLHVCISAALALPVGVTKTKGFVPATRLAVSVIGVTRYINVY